jgi:hypothetical protein
MGSLLATHQHGSEGWAHTGGAVNLKSGGRAHMGWAEGRGVCLTSAGCARR